jgi:hypothetical protein
MHGGRLPAATERFDARAQRCESFSQNSDVISNIFDPHVSVAPQIFAHARDFRASPSRILSISPAASRI